MSRKEIEIIEHTRMSQLEIFVVEMTAREPHGHGDLEIGILLEGTLQLSVEHTLYTLKAGDIYVINRHQVHSFARTNPSARILAFQINSNFYQKIHPSYNYLFFTENVIQGGQLRRQLYSLLLSCAQMYFSNKAFAELKCSSILLDALYLLVTHTDYAIMSEKESAFAKNNSLRLNRITDYIATHHNQKLTLSQIAELEGVTDYHISHFMTQMLGISFQNYLNQVRFEHALHLLNDTHLCLLDICMETGFSSTRYLNQMFEKNFHCTASEYRKLEEKPSYYSTALSTKDMQFRYSYTQSCLFMQKFTNAKI